jgi:hypothetical protein
MYTSLKEEEERCEDKKWSMYILLYVISLFVLYIRVF